MNQRFSLNNLEIEPPKHLKEAVLRQIKLEQDKRIWRKKVMYLGGILFSGGAALFSIGYFGKGFITSDFWSLALLICTDLKMVAGLWQEFMLSLLETFPFEALACILTPLFILLVLAKKYSEYSEQPRLTKLKFKF